MVRNSISSYEWVANDLKGNRELLSVILQSKNREVAPGTVCMAVDQACELNQEIEERLISDAPTRRLQWAYRERWRN